MGTKLINFALPEFAFLDANAHEGDLLEGRTVIQHIRTYTVMEAIALDETGALSLKDTVKKFEFEYTNAFNITERHILALHFTLADEDDTDQLHQIFQKTAKWYCDYLRWEDQNIANEARGFGN
jgi:predicted outer membrane protein